MNSDQYRSFLIMIKALDQCLSYSQLRVSIQLPNIEECKMACSELVARGYEFKISSNFMIHIYRGNEYK